jgi:excinuclease ABC subunit B
MQRTLEETERRREKQIQYNLEHGIIPQRIVKANRTMITGEDIYVEHGAYIEPDTTDIAAEPIVKYMSKKELDKAIAEARNRMEKAAKELNFVDAATYRDEMYKLMKLTQS